MIEAPGRRAGSRRAVDLAGGGDREHLRQVHRARSPGLGDQARGNLPVSAGRPPVSRTGSSSAGGTRPPLRRAGCGRLVPSFAKGNAPRASWAGGILEAAMRRRGARAIGGLVTSAQSLHAGVAPARHWRMIRRLTLSSRGEGLSLLADGNLDSLNAEVRFQLRDTRSHPRDLPLVEGRCARTPAMRGGPALQGGQILAQPCQFGGLFLFAHAPNYHD